MQCNKYRLCIDGLYRKLCEFAGSRKYEVIVRDKTARMVRVEKGLEAYRSAERMMKP